MGRLHLQACPQQPVGDVSTQVDVHGEMKWAAGGANLAGREGARTGPHHLNQAAHCKVLPKVSETASNGALPGSDIYGWRQPDWHLSEKIRTSRSVFTDAGSHGSWGNAEIMWRTFRSERWAGRASVTVWGCNWSGLGTHHHPLVAVTWIKMFKFFKGLNKNTVGVSSLNVAFIHERSMSRFQILLRVWQVHAAICQHLSAQSTQSFLSSV